MEAQNFKTIETKPLSLSIYNAAESSFGVASVIIYGKTEAVLIDAQFTLADAEKVANEIKNSEKILKTIPAISDSQAATNWNQQLWNMRSGIYWGWLI